MVTAWICGDVSCLPRGSLPPEAVASSPTRPEPGIKAEVSSDTDSTVEDSAPRSQSASLDPASAPGVFDTLKWRSQHKHPLKDLGMQLLAPVCSSLKIDRNKVSAFLEHVDKSMLDNPYHNSLHIMDAMQMMNFMINGKGPLAEMCTDPILHLAAILGILCHDLLHPGLTNAYLQNTHSPLVDEYGKESTLESMHFAAAKTAYLSPDMDFMRELQEAQRSRVFQLTEQMILATDMSKHAQLVSAPSPPDAEGQILYKLILAVKCCDLSHCMRKFRVHLMFVQGLKNEFYNQGDKEKDRGVAISMGMDRDESYKSMASSQVFFLNTFVRPLIDVFHTATDQNPCVEQMIQQLDRNITSWKMLCTEDEAVQFSDQRTEVPASAKLLPAESILDGMPNADLIIETIRRMYELGVEGVVPFA